MNIEKVLLCPKCHFSLVKIDKSFVCSNKHCYDLSKENYVNLLLSNQKKSKAPGDDKTMISARDNFLQRGYYSRLREAIETIVRDVHPRFVLDAGCGTGYYIENLQHEFSTIGVDISKEAVRCLAKKNKNCLGVVASIFDLPIADNSIDLILNIFAPKPQEEFRRILTKKTGVLVEVVPGQEHLKELKEKLFCESRTLNKERFSFGKFKLKTSHRLKYSTRIETNNDLTDLLKMTPYYYTGGKNRVDLIHDIESIEITLDFIINILEIV